MTQQHTTPTVGPVVDLGTPWRGVGPFLIVGKHVDTYPRANPAMGPDLESSDSHNWSMYHGTEVPGFPAHPHRGFETITLVRRGHVDHADSTGAGARYAAGDVQWVTTGHGVVHSEMFPLLDETAENPFELYQIWLNLPARSKAVDPEFAMLWREQIPVVTAAGPHGNARVTVIAGDFDGTRPPAPPSASFAADPASDVAVWLVELDPHASIELPSPHTDHTSRMLYVHGKDGSIEVGSKTVREGQGIVQTGQGRLSITAGDAATTVLVLQGIDIGEPVAQHGPFVMNTAREVEEAYADYRRTQFGGWPWPTTEPVYPRETGRFARYGDGRVEFPDQSGVSPTR